MSFRGTLIYYLKLLTITLKSITTDYPEVILGTIF